MDDRLPSWRTVSARWGGRRLMTSGRRYASLRTARGGGIARARHLPLDCHGAGFVTEDVLKGPASASPTPAVVASCRLATSLSGRLDDRTRDDGEE
jgi:hypothetical protein